MRGRLSLDRRRTSRRSGEIQESGYDLARMAFEIILAPEAVTAVIRVFYDVTETQVLVLAIVTKAEAQAWLDEQGTPTSGHRRDRDHSPWSPGGRPDRVRIGRRLVRLPPGASPRVCSSHRGCAGGAAGRPRHAASRHSLAAVTVVGESSPGSVPAHRRGVLGHLASAYKGRRVRQRYAHASRRIRTERL